MNTAIFMMGVFGIMCLLLMFGLPPRESLSEGEKFNNEQRQKFIIMVIGLIFCLLWLVTGIVIILMKH